jgi:hypothetical protein
MHIGEPESGGAPPSAHFPCALYAESFAAHADPSVVSGSAAMQLPCRSGVAIDPQQARSSRQAGDAALLSLLHPAKAANASPAKEKTAARARGRTTVRPS